MQASASRAANKQQLKRASFTLAYMPNHADAPLPLHNCRGVILPSGTACNFVGLGYIGCDFSFPCTSWVQGDIFMGASRGAPTSVQSLFHEMGHNQVNQWSRPVRRWPGLAGKLMPG